MQLEIFGLCLFCLFVLYLLIEKAYNLAAVLEASCVAPSLSVTLAFSLHSLLYSSLLLTPLSLSPLFFLSSHPYLIT